MPFVPADFADDADLERLVVVRLGARGPKRTALATTYEASDAAIP